LREFRTTGNVAIPEETEKAKNIGNWYATLLRKIGTFLFTRLIAYKYRRLNQYSLAQKETFFIRFSA
jgi:deferrochelatase/peroxidase EfeB